MQKDKLLMVALAIIIAVLLVLFFRGRSEIKKIRTIGHQIESTNKKLQKKNTKLKASLVRYNQVVDSLNAAVGDLNIINDDVADVISNSISSFTAIHNEIDDIVVKSNEVIHSSEGAISEDSLEPIIP